MTKNVQMVRQATSVAVGYIGLIGQLIVDLGLNVLRVHDGATPGGFPLLGAANNLDDLESLTTARSNLDVYSKEEINALTVVVPGTFYGCNTARNGATPNTKIDIASGFLADSTNTVYITCLAGTIDCTAVGANGLDAGALANNTWYYSYAIKKADGTTAYIMSTNAVSPTLPADYIYWRLVWFHKTDGAAHFINYRQVDEDHFWDVAPIDALNVVPANTLNVAVALSVPTGYKVTPKISLRGAASAGAVLFTLGDGGATAGGGGSQWFVIASAGSDIYEVIPCLRTNTTRQIMIQASVTTCLYTIFTLGFSFNRGRV